MGGGGVLAPCNLPPPPPPPDPPVVRHVREFPEIVDKLILEVFFSGQSHWHMIYPSTYYYHFLGHHWKSFFFFFFVVVGPPSPTIPIHPGLQTNEALFLPCGKKVLKLSGCYWGPLMLKKLTVVLWCVYMCLKQKNNFIYMTKILLLLIKLVCDTIWLSSYFNTISKTLPWYINELIVNLI